MLKKGLMIQIKSNQSLLGTLVSISIYYIIVIDLRYHVKADLKFAVFSITNH